MIDWYSCTQMVDNLVYRVRKWAIQKTESVILLGASVSLNFLLYIGEDEGDAE